MKRRSASQKESHATPKHRRASITGGSLEIKDCKDGVVTKCSNISCRDVIPNCFASVSNRCARSGITSRWYHISIGEHYCTACFEEISRPNGLMYNNYRRWLQAWTENSKSQPSHRLFVAEEILPYWVQCNFCEKWRCLPKDVELSTELIANFSCQSTVRDCEKNCAATDDSRARAAKELKWMETLSVPPLIKHSPAALFLYDEYFSDGVGMSPTTKKTDIVSFKIDPELAAVMHPFYQPNENGKAMCLRPDVMEYDEFIEFPEYARANVLYLGLRNLIVALWNLNPKQWLTPQFCMQHLICRGLVRILCSKELIRILTFLNRKGIVNFGVLRNPPYPLLDQSLKKLKVIIVGAGIAGLAAARQLDNFGAQVTVLEARSRIGGRVCDEFRLGAVVGRGAQLVTGVVNNPITIMSLQSGVKYKNMGEECPLIAAQTGTIVPIKTDKRVDFHFNAMLDAVEDWRREAKRDVSLEDTLSLMHKLFLKQANISFTPLENQLLDFHLCNLEYSCGAPLGEVSSLYWDQNEQFAQFAGQHTLMVDGCSAVFDRLAEGLDVRTEFEVTKIDYSSSQVKVYSKSGKPIVCNKILVTLPLALLKWQAVEFVPPLPEDKSRAIKALGAGIIEKVALKFSTKFWHKTNGADYFGNVPDSEDVKNLFTIFYDFSIKDPVTKEYSYVLMSYLSGKAVKLVRMKSDEEIVESAMLCLKRLFPEENVPEPENYFVTHWWEDPCSGMSYSYVRVGSSGAHYDTLAEQIEDKVYFAGEATNRHFPQTVTGAYLSGLREACKIATK